MHALAQEQNKTCIDCHKGIAHNLPHMEKVQQSFIPADMLKANENLLITKMQNNLIN